MLRSFGSLRVESEGQFPKENMGEIIRAHQHSMTGNRKIERGKGLSIPSETSVSCGVVARDTEKPPLSKIDASSSDSSESVMAKASAVFFTSTCRRARMNTTGEGNKRSNFLGVPSPLTPNPLRAGYSKADSPSLLLDTPSPLDLTTGEKPASSVSLSLSVSASGSSPPGGTFFPCRSREARAAGR